MIHNGVDQAFRAEQAGGIVTVTIDAPGQRVNTFTPAVAAELDRLVSQLGREPELTAVVFRSGKPGGFIAGADLDFIRRIGSRDEAVMLSERGQELFERVERLPVPTVAVIEGACLGGGLEFALACRYRLGIDDPQTQLGLPEVELGLVPAWGGTQRLPRVIGIARGLDMILTGRKVSAQEAFKIGLVDRLIAPGRVDDGLREFLADMARKTLPSHRGRIRFRSLGQFLVDSTFLGRAVVVHRARRMVRQRTRGNYPAALEAIEAVRRGIERSRTAGREAERQAFGRLLFTPQARHLIDLFFLRQRARKLGAGSAAAPPRPAVERIGVIGAGVMGGGIAQVCALAGYSVVLKDVSGDALAAGMKRIDELFDHAVSRRRVSRQDAVARRAGIRATTAWDGFEAADVIIEAAVEDLGQKRSLFAELSRIARPGAVLATNTSSLTIREITEDVERPAWVGGLHFFNPPHKMPLVEVVRAAETCDPAVDAMLEVVRTLGKTPVVVADSPGFLVNRVLVPYLNESGQLLAERAAAGYRPAYLVKAIDEALRRFGMPMGPFELLDQVGLDVAWHVGRALQERFQVALPASPVLKGLVDQGWLGKKSGRGFYTYGRSGRQWLDNAALARVLPRAAKGIRGRRLPLDVHEVQNRLVLPMINEAVRALELGIAAEPGLLDLAMVLGIGFAPFRGGPLRMADDLGPAAVVDQLKLLEARHGPRFAPAKLLVQKAHGGERFYEAAAVAAAG